MNDVERDCIFCKVVRGEIPSTTVYRDDTVTAFRDISPAAPTHVLVIPNRHVARVADFGEADEALIGRLVTVANRLARESGVAESGYRLIVNNGPDSGQLVFHVHVHLIGGRPLGPLLAG